MTDEDTAMSDVADWLRGLLSVCSGTLWFPQLIAFADRATRRVQRDLVPLLEGAALQTLVKLSLAPSGRVLLCEQLFARLGCALDAVAGILR